MNSNPLWDIVKSVTSADKTTKVKVVKGTPKKKKAGFKKVKVIESLNGE